MSALDPGSRAIFAIVVVFVALAAYMYATQHARSGDAPAAESFTGLGGWMDPPSDRSCSLPPWRSGEVLALASPLRREMQGGTPRIDVALMSPLMRHAGALAAQGVAADNVPYGTAALPRVTGLLDHYEKEDGYSGAFGRKWRFSAPVEAAPRVGEQIGPVVLNGTAVPFEDPSEYPLSHYPTDDAWQMGAGDYYDPASGNARPYLSGQGSQRFSRLQEQDASPLVGATSWL